MMNAEQVVIDIIANDKATSILENVRGKLIEINMRASEYASKISSLNQPTSAKIPNTANVPTPTNPSVKQPTDASQTSLDEFKNPQTSLDNFSKKGSDIPIQSKLEQFNNTANTTKQTMDSAGQSATNFGQKVSQATSEGAKSTSKLNENLTDIGKKGSEAGNNVNKSFKVGVSTFHEMNTLLMAVGGQFQNMSSQIAGLFGAAGFSGMIEKMWKGAAERQTNMLYLIHQKGVSQANEYYNEIMDIVAKLPGDDTFLTNILNMASAMDENIKLDNLKELGSAITDYYIAATMKGELPFETQKDLRKYLTTGETKPLRNSLLANEIDLLKNKNSVLERGQALQEALEKNGLEGMSQYESATNALEEFKGHFQKAFADIGTIITSIAQPILKLYNALDTVFGSRLSQAIILVATALIGFFGLIGTSMILFPVLVRNIEILGISMRIMSNITKTTAGSQGLLNAVLTHAIGIQNAEAIAVDGSVTAGMRKIAIDTKKMIASRLNIAVTEQETISIWGLTTALLSKIKFKIIELGLMAKRIILGEKDAVILGSEILLEGRATAQNLTSMQVERARNVLTANSIRAKMLHRIATIKDTLSTAYEIIVKGNLNAIQGSSIFMNILETLSKWELIKVTTDDAGIQIVDANNKSINTVATLGLAVATGILDAALGFLLSPIMLIIGAIIGLIVVMEKLGEAFGWWSNFGSMIGAISDGINRLWSAFMNSDIIQGIIQYFGDFIATIQDVFQSIYSMFAMLFGWEDDGGTFDIVHSLISVFGKLGEIISWVWNLMDDWSNSPLGIITWLNPLGILLFHLDEIGSFFEDIRDAIDRFTGTEEFQELSQAIGEVWTAIQEPFQEIWSLIEEIISLFSEVFSDPEGQGTEDRINVLVEVFKALAFIIRVTVIPSLQGFAFILKVVLLPLRVILTVVREIGKFLTSASEGVKGFAINWEILIPPLFIIKNLIGAIEFVIRSVSVVFSNFINTVSSMREVRKLVDFLQPIFEWLYNYFALFINEIAKIINAVINIGDTVTAIVQGIGNAINFLIGIIKSTVGVLWNMITGPMTFLKNTVEGVINLVNKATEIITNSPIGVLLGWDKKEDKDSSKSTESSKGLYDKLNGMKMNNTNVNNVRNLGKSYNNTNNQKQVIINQNFSEGSMPIDARNMTKKEARKMFIGAFGYNRSVGSRGILR